MIDDTLRLTKAMHPAMNRVQCSRTVPSEWSICIQNSFWLYLIFYFFFSLVFALLSKNKRTRAVARARRGVYELLICIQFACILHWWFTVLCIYSTFPDTRETAFACKRQREYAWEQIFLLLAQNLGFSCSKFFANVNNNNRTGEEGGGKSWNCHLSCFGILHTSKCCNIALELSIVWVILFIFFSRFIRLDSVNCNTLQTNEHHLMQSNWCQSISDME